MAPKQLLSLICSDCGSAFQGYYGALRCGACHRKMITEKAKAVRLRRMAEHCCDRCGNKLPDNYTDLRCADCKRKRKYTPAQHPGGTCKVCGKSADSTYSNVCETCWKGHYSEKWEASRERRQERRKAAHKCVRCSMELADTYNNAMCPTCIGLTNGSIKKGGVK